MKSNRTELAIGVALLFGVAALFIFSKPEPAAPVEKQVAVVGLNRNQLRPHCQQNAVLKRLNTQLR